MEIIGTFYTAYFNEKLQFCYSISFFLSLDLDKTNNEKISKI